MNINNIRENFINIKQQIKDTALSCGRDPEGINLVVVTKKHTSEEIQYAINSGVEFIGENQVQEAERKIPYLKNLKEFHFIGHLQSNKIRKLLALKPVLIHSLDNLNTAEKLNQVAEEMSLNQQVLVQVNVSGEKTKTGIDPVNCSEFLNDLQKYPSISVLGLMTIGMNTEDETLIRNGFRELKNLFDQQQKVQRKNCFFRYLSMGMSSDFRLAIAEGANIIRVGSAIMGERIY